MLPSILGIILCMVCLAGATWAWFSDSVQTGPQTITAANYGVNVEISGAGEDGVNVRVPAQPDGGYILNGNTLYTIHLTASGTAQTGYCKIQTPQGESLYTDQISKDMPLTFTLIPEEDGRYSFTAVWGTYSGGDIIRAGDQLGQEILTDPAEDSSAPPAETAPAAPEGEEPVSAPEQEQPEGAHPSGEELSSGADPIDQT